MQVKNYWEDAVEYTGKKAKDKLINKRVLRMDQILTGVVLGGVVYHYFFSLSQKSLCRGEEK